MEKFTKWPAIGKTTLQSPKHLNGSSEILKPQMWIIRKGWCKINVTTHMKMNIVAFRGYICTLYWPVRLIIEFLTFQEAFQTIFMGFAKSTLHFDEFFWQNWDFCKNSFCTKIDVNLDSEVLQKPTLAHQKAQGVSFLAN